MSNAALTILAASAFRQPESDPAPPPWWLCVLCAATLVAGAVATAVAILE